MNVLQKLNLFIQDSIAFNLVTNYTGVMHDTFYYLEAQSHWHVDTEWKTKNKILLLKFWMNLETNCLFPTENINKTKIFNVNLKCWI